MVPPPRSGQTAQTLAPSGRSTLRRKRDRGSYDLAEVHAILDEGLVCHVGFTDRGRVFVQPMAHVRVADDLYLHGARANRCLGRLVEGADACITVTLVDGLVLARSAFHHSVNSRTVMLFGTGVEVTGEEEKAAAAAALLDHLVPGRAGEARPPNSAELRATLFVRFPIAEGSVKIRSGPPIDDEEDLVLPVWAGQLPLELACLPPVPDPALASDVELSPAVRAYRPPRPSLPD